MGTERTGSAREIDGRRRATWRTWGRRRACVQGVVSHAVVIGVSLLGYPIGAGARIATPIRGQVVDAVTGQPIAGAVVARQPIVDCLALHGGSHTLRPHEVETDGEGRFAVGAGVDIYPCVPVGWQDRLQILAPGYRLVRVTRYGSGDFTIEEKLGPGPVRLTPARSAAERAQAADEATQTLRLDEAGPRWRAAVVRARQLAGPEPSPGRLGRWPGARFDAVAVIADDTDPARGSLVLAHDRESRQAVAWRLDGTLVGVRPWPAPGPRREPIPEAVLPPKTWRVDCTGAGPVEGTVLIGVQTLTGPAVLVWVPGAAAAARVAVPTGWLAGLQLGPCAGLPGTPRVWLTPRPGEVLELDLAASRGGSPGRPSWAVTTGRVRTTSGLPPLWHVAAARGADGTERLYAVTGEDRVHQLLADDLPVRRLEGGPVPEAPSR